MTRQWLRYCKLTVDGLSDGISLSDFRIRFSVEQQTLQSPPVMDVTITNLSDQTVKKIKDEGSKVTLDAGYEDGHGIIFKGQIIQKRSGRENPVDTYLNILSQGGDQAYNHAVVSKTLSAGHTFKDQVDVILEAFKPFGITAGHISDLGTKKMPRARVMFGMARDVMRTIAISTGTSWFIHNDELNVIKDKETTPGNVTVLNSRTGMIGLPTQTIDGISVTALLNPAIRPGSLIQINQSDIQAAKFSADYTAELNNAMIPTIAEDGFYKVLVIRHHGDTRGNDWYTDMLCVRADGKGPLPIGLYNKGLVVE